MDLFSETTTEAKFEDLVGEGKKYSDQDAAAKAIVEKDKFIARLLEEKRKLEEDHRAALNTQAFEDRIKALEAAKSIEAREPTPAPVTSAPTTPVDIEGTVQKAIEQREQAQQRTRNLMNVKDKLTETFGAEYPNRVKARAQELNISMDRLNALAAETPSAFFALIGLGDNRSPDNVAPPATRQNSAAAFSPHTDRKNNAYYSNLRKTNPTVYYSPKVQMEEYNELKRQGDAFYS
jgi:DNA primase